MVPRRPARVLKLTRDAFLFEEGCTADDTWERVQGVGCRVHGSGFRVQGSGFRV
jgi:hypothetical protein